MRFKRVMLVNPPKVEQIGYFSAPIGLLYLASYLKHKNKKIELRVVDGTLLGEERVKREILDFRPDLLGVTAMTCGRHSALKVTRFSKKTLPSSCVVLGGVHPTLMWKQMMENYNQIDFICRGEGELTLNELVQGKDLTGIDGLVWRKATGEIIKNKEREPVNNLDTLPFPAWEMVDPLKYPSRGEGVVNGIDLSRTSRFPVIFSRGCMGSCTFCSSWKVWKGYRSRSGKNVAREIAFLVRKYKAKHIYLSDDSFGGDKKAVIEFCQEILKRKIKVAIETNLRVDTIDEQILGWMKRAGFYLLIYGVESGSPRMLKKVNKKIELRQIKNAFRLTQKVGIRTSALMMYGLPGERQTDLLASDALLKKINPADIGTLGETWIFPGTVLYEQAKSQKLLNDKFWLGRRSYYIYRGGLDGDPVNWSMKAKDLFGYNKMKSLFAGFIIHFFKPR